MKLNFPKIREKFDVSQRIKRDARIIVVIGNPPYDRVTGAAQAGEAELVAHYKGIELVTEKNKKGEPKRDAFGRPKMKLQGERPPHSRSARRADSARAGNLSVANPDGAGRRMADDAPVQRCGSGGVIPAQGATAIVGAGCSLPV